jgi:hypothetical protein
MSGVGLYITNDAAAIVRSFRVSLVPLYITSSLLRYGLYRVNSKLTAPDMKLFIYEAWSVPRAGFDPPYSFVRSHFVSPMVLASIRTVLSLYSFTTIIICYAWLAHNTATMELKDVNTGSYTTQ